jgi:hypothetical protein
VAKDASGAFVVVWQSYYFGEGGYGGYDIIGQRFAASGARIGAEFRVNAYTTFGQSFAAVASTPGGGFVVAWSSNGQDGNGYGVFARRFAASGSLLGDEFQVNTYTTSSQGLPAVATDPSGRFVVAWQSLSQDGSILGIFAQRYDPAGTPIGTEFRVNTHTTNSVFAFGGGRRGRQLRGGVAWLRPGRRRRQRPRPALRRFGCGEGGRVPGEHVHDLVPVEAGRGHGRQRQLRGGVGEPSARR